MLTHNAIRRLWRIMIDHGTRLPSRGMAIKRHFMDVTMYSSVSTLNGHVKFVGPNWTVKSDDNMDDIRITRGTALDVMTDIQLMVLSV